MFAQWTIGKKLGLSLGFLVILTLAVGFVAWRAVSSLGDQLDTAINRTTAKILLADHISQLTDQISADNRGMMLGYMNKDAKFVQSNMADMADKRRTIDNEIQQIRPLLLTAEGKAATEELEQSWGMYDPLLRQYQELGEKGNFAEAQALLTDGLAPARARIDANSDKLIKVERDLLAQSQKDAAATSSSSRWSLIVAICISLATGILRGVRPAHDQFQPSKGDQRFERRGWAGSKRRGPDIFVQPVVGTGNLGTGSGIGGDICLE